MFSGVANFALKPGESASLASSLLATSGRWGQHRQNPLPVRSNRLDQSQAVSMLMNCFTLSYSFTCLRVGVSANSGPGLSGDSLSPVWLLQDSFLQTGLTGPSEEGSISIEIIVFLVTLVAIQWYQPQDDFAFLLNQLFLYFVFELVWYTLVLANFSLSSSFLSNRLRSLNWNSSTSLLSTSHSGRWLFLSIYC